MARLQRRLLELSKLVPSKLRPFCWYVYPQAAMSADGRCALNSKPDHYGRSTPRSQIDVTAGNIRTPIILQRQEIDLIRRRDFGCHHELLSGSMHFNQLDSTIAESTSAKLRGGGGGGGYGYTGENRKCGEEGG